MNEYREFALRALFGPATVVAFCLLFVPLTLGVLDTRLMTPFAAPGYALLLAMTVVGSYVLPQYGLWIYWIPFTVVCYGIAAVVGGLYYGIGRFRDSSGSASTP
ncbi:hypothetical protein C491_11843 [Natronococcus amylolyticus DSM 10524]|uniref:Uncharacterized protein n=1 Tax=Natronococcus amylolyticus DSM 10524 TaxID=1227497 RepID=L9X6F5_9EURY|nr:hypothetical protein [Natronococcus amylolyticus]ELY57192.1 hypothetical protein C491_11843 [Natronococcus amylolyticus DSM 10524]